MGKAVKAGRGFRLAQLDMSKALTDQDAYERALEDGQLKMLSIQQAYRRDHRPAILVFEGWDAAGKGGAIKRLTERLDPHAYHVWPIGPPTPEERDYSYLERFWRRLPRIGELAIFDRSWYGRVLVERVEKLAPPKAWKRAYDEINAFEAMLIADGTPIVKFFLHVSPQEQLRRFRERIESPYKHWKIGGADIRNYLERRAYEAAVDDMLGRTSTRLAPWFVVPGDAKWYARIAVLETAVHRLSEGVDLEPPALDPEFIDTLRQLADKKLLKQLGNAEKIVKSSRRKQ